MHLPVLVEPAPEGVHAPSSIVAMTVRVAVAFMCSSSVPPTPPARVRRRYRTTVTRHVPGVHVIEIVLVEAVPIGGLRMIDGDEADDKIIAVLAGDPAFKDITDVAACPSGLRDRLQHYFLTYKQPPDGSPSKVEIAEVYGREEAHEVIRASIADYKTSFAGLHDMVAAALRP